MQKLLRNSFFLLVSIFFIQSVSAQLRFETQHHFKPFEVLLDAGLARPQGKGAKAGVLLALEPRFNALDRLAVGLRMEATAMARVMQALTDQTRMPMAKQVLVFRLCLPLNIILQTEPYVLSLVAVPVFIIF
jgi:hypothetical protein